MRGDDIYNLKWWVTGLIACLATAPFIFYSLVAESALDYLSRNYGILDVFTATILVLPALLLIGFNQAVAKFCARDKSRVAETMRSVRNASYLIAVMVLISIIALVFG